MPVGSGFGFVVFSALPAGKEKAAWGSKPKPLFNKIKKKTVAVNKVTQSARRNR